MTALPQPADLARLTQLWNHLPRVCRSTRFVDDGYGTSEIEIVTSPEQGSIMTSAIVNSKLHAPVLDIDIPAALIASSTAGHSHLIIEKALTWRQYKRLLRELARAGIVERGYYTMSRRRGYSSVRLPWVRKQSTS